MSTTDAAANESGTWLMVTPGARLWLAADKKFFGPGVARLLMLIVKTGAIKAACAEMGVSYTKARKMVALVESELGCAIVISQQGGQHGSSSALTETGKELLVRYKMFESECEVLVKEAYAKSFDGFMRQPDNES